VGIGSRKRRGDRTMREESPESPSSSPADDAQRDAIIARLFDGVLRSARSQLLRADSPLAAEVWGSGLMAVWEGLPAATGANPFSPGGDTAAGLEQLGIPAPVWAGVAGTAVPTEAWIGSDVYGDQEIVIVGFTYPGLPDAAMKGNGDHSICVLVDHTERGAAKDAYPAAPLPQTLARWREAEGDGIGLRPVSLAEVAARLADALVATDFSAGSVDDGRTPADGRTLGEMRALLAGRLNTLPPAAATGVEELDAEGRDWLVAEFLGSPEAAGLLSEPAAVTICHSLIAYRCDYGDGDPLRWSPTLAGLCLLDHFPVRVSLDAPDVGLVPDVLAAWVGFAGRRRHLPERALARILDVVDSCREDFPVAMGDASRYSPAKRSAMDLLHRGIDLTEERTWASVSR
jgi:hypothetical protein